MARSGIMSWYDGPTIMECLIRQKEHQTRGAVQAFNIQLSRMIGDRNILCGEVLHGRLQAGESLTHFPSGNTVQITYPCGTSESSTSGSLSHAILETEKEVEMRRGDYLYSGSLLQSNRLNGIIIWLDVDKCTLTKDFVIQQNSRLVGITRITPTAQYDLDSMSWDIPLCDHGNLYIFRAIVEVEEDMLYSYFSSSKRLGGALIIDSQSCRTSAVFLITE